MFRKSLHESRFCPRRAATATAAALAFAFAGTALGQPAGGPGFGGHGYGGHGGPHGAMMGGGEEMIGKLIANAREKLNLNTQQQGLFEAAVAQSKNARESARALHQKVRDALTLELAKTEPDLSVVAGVADGVHADAQALRKGVRDAWLKVYAALLPEQKTVVKDMLQQRLARMDAFRQKMHDRAAAHGS